MIQRGDIYWADLGRPAGSEPAKRRPVLVVQADSFNASRINTVLAAVVTSNQRLAAAPGNVALPDARLPTAQRLGREHVSGGDPRQERPR